jgi:hypothetical protein
VPHFAASTGGRDLSKSAAVKTALSALVSGALLVSLVLSALAQEVRRFHGRVAWIAGQTMIVAADTRGSLNVPQGGGSLNVDLTNVDQSAYNGLRAGARVTVVGVVSEDRAKLIAWEVIPDPQPGSALHPRAGRARLPLLPAR